MHWEDVKLAYPSQWVLIEAIDAKTEGDSRMIEEISVVDTFKEDSRKAMRRYVELHKQHKDREYYVVNTQRLNLDIKILRWVGVRPG
jgi:hypothetical protein